MELLTLICARKGSKGIKNKNIKLFNGKPLIYYTIKKALTSKFIDEVYVSTDSNKISKISKVFGAKVRFLRKKNLSQDNTPEIKVWQDAISRLEKLNKKKYDYLCVLPVTSPLRLTKDIDDCIKIFKSKKCDGVISITPSSKNPYFNMVQINKSNLNLINRTKKKIFTRQKSPKVYDVTTVAYVMSTKFIKEKNSIFDGKLKYTIIPKLRSVDIDDEIDFKFAEFLYRKKWK
jgi:CMP-N-acetylneuraminic acid synthetase